MIGRSAFVLRTTNGGQFLAELGQERRNGNISPDMGQRVKLAFRTVSWDAPDAALAAAVGAEIDRVERDVAVVRKLRAEARGRDRPMTTSSPTMRIRATMRKTSVTINGASPCDGSSRISSRGFSSNARPIDNIAAARQRRLAWRASFTEQRRARRLPYRIAFSLNRAERNDGALAEKPVRRAAKRKTLLLYADTRRDVVDDSGRDDAQARRLKHCLP
jgi:hypothetical protein